MIEGSKPRTAISDRVSVLLESHTGERTVAEECRVERVKLDCLGVEASSIWVVVLCRTREIIFWDNGSRAEYRVRRSSGDYVRGK